MKGDDFDYNTNREKLVLPEYGRNIQKLVKYLMAIESREERNRYAQSLIQVMGNLNPHLRDINDFKHKLWDHLAIISDFKLDFDSPYPSPTPESIMEKPRKVPYGTTDPRYKHYGKNVELMIEKVCSMEEGADKQELIMMIANMMKKFYLAWNKESVNDDLIFKDLAFLSKNRIVLGPEVKLEDSRDILYRANKKKTNYTNHGNHSNHSNHGSNNHNNQHKRRY